MAQSWPPVKGVAFTIRVMLRDFSVPGAWKANPTIAAGDFKVDIDGAGFNNPATLPSVSPASGEAVLITLSTSEMNGDVITVKWIDQTATKEWADGGLCIQTTSAALAANVTQWLGTAAATPTVAGVPEVDVTHVAGATTDVSALATNVAAILVDTGTTLQAELDGIQAEIPALTTAVADLPTNAELATALAAADDAVLAVLGSPAGASMSADIAAMKVDTAAILVDTGTTLDAALATVDGIVDAILVDTAEIGAAGAGLAAIPWNAAWDAETQSEVADALAALVIEGTVTLPQALRAILGACAGILSGAATTTVTIRDTTNSKDRIIATVDADGNRSAVTLDLT
jgi:hypothetical protein